MSFDLAPFFSQYIRVILFIIFIRALREALKRVALVIYDSKEILMFIIAYIIIFGWIGHRLFRGTQQGEAYFSSLSESIWSLMVLLTTANFPDVMMPSYRQSSFYAIFFVTYLVFGLYFLLNLVLAIFYSNYRARVEKSLDKFVSIREEFLINKFMEYDDGEKGYLTKEEFKTMIYNLFRNHLKAIKESDVNRIARDFSMKSNGKIKPEDFLNYFEIMDFVSLDNQTNTTKKSKLNERRVKVKKIVMHPIYDAVMSILVIFNLLSIMIKDFVELYEDTKTQLYVWIFCQVFIAWFFLFEMIFI
jgi:two pore calcium channel protein, plant